MKQKNIASLLLFAAVCLLCGCSDDKDSPKPKYSSLVTEFFEAYGVRSLPIECDMDLPVEQREVLVPIEGVESYEATDYNSDISGGAPRVKVNVGKSHTYTNTPHFFNKMLESYGDTDFHGKDTDLSTYRPHPYAITSIDMRLIDEFRYLPLIIVGGEERTPDYSSKFRMGENCNSLFKIRYRTYYDYIRNGYSWAGLEFQSPWKEMDLTEFNRRGGDKLIDMSRFYLIVKEAPQYSFSMLGYAWPLSMNITFENGKTNKRCRELKMEMKVYASMFK